MARFPRPIEGVRPRPSAREAEALRGLEPFVRGTADQRDRISVALSAGPVSLFAEYEPLGLPGSTINGRIGVADVVWLFNHL